MSKISQNEIIVVRALTDSDLGIFAIHRPTTASKQRAININSAITQQLLSSKLFEKGSANIRCRIIYGENTHDSIRHFGKVGKNWRLGGNKIEGDEFLQLDSRDFALIRSIEKNDGSQLITIVFIGRAGQQFHHARIVRLVEPTMRDSMEIYRSGSAGFEQLASLFPAESDQTAPTNEKVRAKRAFSPMPHAAVVRVKNSTIKDKLRSPHMLEQMLKASSDLSAPAQMSFIETVGILAEQLRVALLAGDKIIKLDKDHKQAWKAVEGQTIGFVDGGLANLSMLGSTPIAARVGGYIVKPGDKSPEREKFVVLKKLINELYSSDDDGVYDGSFPDVSALRDAARISIEAAGAVRLITEDPSVRFLFVHGALVNPVSRYTDIMKEGVSRFHFPHFSKAAMTEFVPNVSPIPTGREANFVSIYLRQLKMLENSSTSICGVIEREATTSSVIRALLSSLDDQIIAPSLSMPAAEWKKWVLNIVDPHDEDDVLGQRITDSLLLRCTLEPGEALVPVMIDRNEMRRAPDSWKDVIKDYPKPHVSYLQVSEWSAPIRLEIFAKDLSSFKEIARLIFHCSLLLPRYAFPAGLDIVDKFAKIPNWMSRPVNTNTVVQALKNALYKGDQKLFDSLRRMLCGSTREWLLRPGISK